MALLLGLPGKLGMSGEAVWDAHLEGRSEDIRNLDLFSPDVDLANLDLVIAPLIGTGFDAIEMILLLGKAGFRGRLLVRSGLLPDIDLVVGELREAAEPFGFLVDLAEPH